MCFSGGLFLLIPDVRTVFSPAHEMVAVISTGTFKYSDSKKGREVQVENYMEE